MGGALLISFGGEPYGSIDGSVQPTTLLADLGSGPNSVAALPHVAAI
jgi:hypothetical protein